MKSNGPRPAGEKMEGNPAPNPSKDFERMVALYLASNPVIQKDHKNSEMEVRFGTNQRVAKPLTKIDYDNVISKLYSSGFTTSNPAGLHILRIQNEYTEIHSGMTKVSNIRAEIVGVDLIQEYCRSNSIQKVMDMPSTVSARANKIKFTKKSPPKMENGDFIKSVDFPDFNFRVAYQFEQDYNIQSNIARGIVSSWSDSKKLFRHINRVRFEHPVYPVFGDISIVKSSRKTGKVPIPQYTIQDAGVFQTQEQYEVELEIDNDRVGLGTAYSKPEQLAAAIRKCIRLILSALQGTNYPIAYSERNRILNSYMRLIHGPDYQERRVFPKDFVGPSSYTLQVENIVPENKSSSVPNIRSNYTVTEKADGERKLLYIAENGRLYLIDTNMNVIFTGAMTNERGLYDSLIDGEHIKYDKKHNFINLYGAFDIYYVRKKSVREYAFVYSQEEMEKMASEPAVQETGPKAMVRTGEPVKEKVSEQERMRQQRLLILKKCMELLRPVSIMDQGQKPGTGTGTGPEPAPESSNSEPSPCRFLARCKEFYMASPDMTIFQACSTILSNVSDGLFQYNTDGLIFTPTNTGVGSDKVGFAGPVYKSTWDQSLKWKPAEFNTIDFLVSVKKDKNGKDEIHNIFEEGRNITGVQTITQYKTLILRCGFDERKHGFLNPKQDLIDNKIPSPSDLDNSEPYKPVPFRPTNPYDPQACYCNVMVIETGNRDLIMKTEENEYFEEDMIVEFRYDKSKTGAWAWIPLRVRYDKTAELRSGLRNYGNAYHVANSNWTSIHSPITNEMISSGLNIPEFAAGDEDVYYNKSSKETSTRSLRDFHNLYVKRKLIIGTSARKDTLIDFAVGKGGDLPKWIHGNLGYVFGIDISKDNINNNLDGACARYLNQSRKNRDMPGAMFVVGNSGLNIRSGEAFSTDKDKQIVKAIFGSGPKDRQLLGEGVYQNYGIGHDGFQISSVQFALHYFFDRATTLHEFVRNVAECTKMGGYFIGTCYDGKTVFKLLRRKLRGEGITIMRGDRKIYEITREYEESGFPDDELSLGYAVNVYQESINKIFREYLVNFDYFVRIMEDYGFVLASRDEAERMGLPRGSGMFDELFDLMRDEVRRHPIREAEYGTALDMNEDERTISFMNRYFVFRKIRTVNTTKMGKIIMAAETEEKEMGPDADAGDLMKIKVVTEKKPAVRKLKRVVVLEKYEPVSAIEQKVKVAEVDEVAKVDEPDEPVEPLIIKKPKKKIVIVSDK